MIALIARHLLTDAMGLATTDSVARRRRQAGQFLQRAEPRRRRVRAGTSAQRDRAVRVHRHRVRVRAGRGRVQLRADARSRRTDPDRRLRRRHERLLHPARRSDPAAARARARRHRRHRRRRSRRRRVRQADHPQARRAATGARVRIFLAAGQVPADPELALRTARALASSVFSEYRQESRDAGAACGGAR